MVSVILRSGEAPSGDGFTPGRPRGAGHRARWRVASLRVFPVDRTEHRSL
jgi:hypothetical protein